MSTILLNQKDGTIIDEQVSVFDFKQLGAKDTVVLFTIAIEGAGTIVLDLFQRKTSNIQNIATITERGSSRLAGQTGVGYLIAHFPPEDLQYLSFDQVKVLFHEFGHAMNIALSGTKY